MAKAYGKKFVVYQHTLPNGKIYIGITCASSLNTRFRKGTGYSYNERFTRAINKYGWDNIRHEVLFSDLDRDEACAKEIELIANFHATDPQYGYNILPGGDLSTLGMHWTISEEAKENHRKSAAWKGKKIPADICKKMSEAKKGKPAKNKRPVRCVDTDEVFPSITEAAIAKGVGLKSISMCVTGHRKTAGGYRWSYE